MAMAKFIIEASLFLDDIEIQKLITLFKRILTKRFDRRVNKLWSSEGNRNKIGLEARLLIHKLIYEVWPDNGRTYDLFNSFYVQKVKNDDGATLELISDPRIASAKFYPELSYAAFFEHPGEFNTFIIPRGTPESPRNYRPFMQALTEEVMDLYSTDMADRAIAFEIRNSAPQGLAVTVLESK